MNKDLAEIALKLRKAKISYYNQKQSQLQSGLPERLHSKRILVAFDPKEVDAVLDLIHSK